MVAKIQKDIEKASQIREQTKLEDITIQWKKWTWEGHTCNKQTDNRWTIRATMTTLRL